MEKLKIPFYAVATDLEKGQEMVFWKGIQDSREGELFHPGIFRPVKISDRMYVDGGVVSR